MNLPLPFVERSKDLLGDEFNHFQEALQHPSPTSIRINNKILLNPSEDRVAWCDTGYYLPERPLFTADPLLHSGAYYVQEASSMFLQQMIRQLFPNARRVLDLCAAPGGKSTLLTQTLPETTLIVSNEIIRSRAYILAENIAKWGCCNNIVSNNTPSELGRLTHFFDAIVVDAPCSGEGMFRKDPDSVNEWSVANVKMCAERQREILADVWDSLVPGGVLVYSTCTYNREENEENVDWICSKLGAEKLSLDINYPAIVSTDGGYRFFPHRIKGEGFFISAIRKSPNEHLIRNNFKIDKKGTKFVSVSENGLFRLKNPDNWKYIQENTFTTAYHCDLWEETLWVKKNLKCLSAGVLLGEIKGKDFIPSTVAALSKYLDLDSVESVDLSYEQAISFLRKEAFQLPDAPRGYLLVCYKEIPLGWVKNIGNRCNNLYPNEWRIRMSADKLNSTDNL